MSSNIRNLLFAKAEPERTYFFHSLSRKFLNLLEREALDRVKSIMNEPIRNITDNCNIWWCHAPRSYWFRVSSPDDKILFNHEIAIEVFSNACTPIPHILDIHTEYRNGIDPRSLAARNAWNAFLEA